tara:strand:+ start:6420 stop:7649 length:1230 start_codon:yes stop_codon:yes gene_type:complete
MSFGDLKVQDLIYEDSSNNEITVVISNLATKANPTFTGTVTVPTAAANDNTTKAASTAYVQTELGDYLTTATATSTYAPKANPAFTGTATGVNLTLSGDLTVNGTTTTINTTTLQVEDKNIEIGKVSSPSDTTADGGGITLLASSNKTILWTNATDTWDFNQSVNIASGLDFKVNNVSVLNATALGGSVVGSSLTSVGTLTSLTITGNLVVDTNTLFVDATNNRVGINNASPGTDLDVIGTARANNFVLRTNGSAPTADASIFRAADNTLAFSTSNTERLRIGASGQIGIGGATYGSSGQVLTSGGSGAAPTWGDVSAGATPVVITANRTAVAGDLVVVNGSGLTVTLPASPSVGNFVEVRVLGSRYCTVARNSSKIESATEDLYVDTFDGYVKLIFADATRGWLVSSN